MYGQAQCNIRYVNSDWHRQIAQYTYVTGFFLIHLNRKQHSRDNARALVQIHLYFAKL